MQCKGLNNIALPPRSNKKPERNGFYRKRMFTNVTKNDFIVKKTLRGYKLQPAKHLQVIVMMMMIMIKMIKMMMMMMTMTTTTTMTMTTMTTTT
jgi:hypothetical protein